MRSIAAARGIFITIVLFSLAACSNRAVKTYTLEEQAAQEATAMIEQARATAIILAAQAQATELLRHAETPVPTAVFTPVQTARPGMAVAPTGAKTPEKGALPSPAPEEEAAEEEYKIELIDVTYGGEGGFVLVNFYATFKAAGDLWQGTVSVTDEQSGIVYNEVATMPIIGPLIARPKQWGQPGYIMLVNTSPGLPSTTQVTVVLGQFKQEHVSIRP